MISPTVNKPQIHGHRGARGLFPENSLQGFAAAINWGVDGIEMDVCVTADDALVLSHDLFLNPDFCRDNVGNWLLPPTRAIRTLTLEELRKIDIGAANPGGDYDRRWVAQCTLQHAFIPTLDEVVRLTQILGAETLRFNIELKSDPYHPELAPPPKNFARLLLAEIKRLKIGERIFIQSFDWNLLSALRARQPALQPGYLTSRQPDLNTLDKIDNAPSRWTAQYDIERYSGSIPRLVAAAGGRIWSSNHLDLTTDNISEARNLGLEIYAWTVNQESVCRWLLEQGISVITTDYPQTMLQIAKSYRRASKCALPGAP